MLSLEPGPFVSGLMDASPRKDELDETIDDDARSARGSRVRDHRPGSLRHRSPGPFQRTEHAAVSRRRAERDQAAGASRDREHEGTRRTQREIPVAGHPASTRPSAFAVRGHASLRLLDGASPYSCEVPCQQAGDPAYLLASSDLRPSRGGAKVWCRTARAPAFAMGEPVPSAVVIMGDERATSGILCLPTLSERTSGRGGPGRRGERHPARSGCSRPGRAATGSGSPSRWSGRDGRRCRGGPSVVRG